MPSPSLADDREHRQFSVGAPVRPTAPARQTRRATYGTDETNLDDLSRLVDGLSGPGPCQACPLTG